MSALSRSPLKVFVCPDCQQQVPETAKAEVIVGSEWVVGHFHGGDNARFVKAEEVEVIPVDSLLSNGGRVLTISEEAFKELDRKWSRPVEACIKDDELWFRNAASENSESTEEG
jgi:hypothetical protein